MTDIPAEGNRDDHAFRWYSKLHGIGLSPGVARELYEAFYEAGGARPTNPGDLDDMIYRIWAGIAGDNPAGSEAPAQPSAAFGDAVKQHVTAAGITRQRIEAKFMSLNGSTILRPKPLDMADYLKPGREPPPPRRDLIPNLVAWGTFVPILGKGGWHKSRMAEQMTLAKRSDRELLMQREIVDGILSYRLGGPRPCGGVPVTHIEYLGYEDPTDEVDRRTAAMAIHFREPETPCAYRWHPLAMCDPVLQVPERGGMRLTDLGVEVLSEWDDIAAGGTAAMLLWLDSFFDAISMEGKARIDDAIAMQTIAALNRWCALLNATIISPFNVSAAGARDDDPGYAPAFRNKSRCVLQIRPHKEPKGEKKEKLTALPGTEIFDLLVHKWNGGPQGEGTRRVFWYENGQLVTEAGA
jgi:hypothetical protein